MELDVLTISEITGRMLVEYESKLAVVLKG